jgi:thioredoxin reductase
VEKGSRPVAVDVLVVGGSVAGLSAALLLARCRRNVTVVDAGRPRNRASRHMHGFLSREGISPSRFLRISRNQLKKYSNVQLAADTVRSVVRQRKGFLAETENGARWEATIVLLATGIIDELPDLPGVDEFYGKSVHHCPYCDGWEHRDKPIGVHGGGRGGSELAREMLIWSRDVIYFSDGKKVPTRTRRELTTLGVVLEETPIVALKGRKGMLQRIVLADGRQVKRSGLFFQSSQRQNCDLAAKLGCDFKEGLVDCDEKAKTGIRGLYVAGNTSSGLQLAVVAAADGARAAHLINTELLERAESSQLRNR